MGVKKTGKGREAGSEETTHARQRSATASKPASVWQSLNALAIRGSFFEAGAVQSHTRVSTGEHRSNQDSAFARGRFLSTIATRISAKAANRSMYK